MARRDGDTWGVTQGVGATALGVAGIRQAIFVASGLDACAPNGVRDGRTVLTHQSSSSS
jgi:hypothetical protein